MEYLRVRDVNFTSATKIKNDLDKRLDSLASSGVKSTTQHSSEPTVNKGETIPVPTDVEMETFYSKLGNCKRKAVALSLVPPMQKDLLKKVEKSQL